MISSPSCSNTWIYSPRLLRRFKDYINSFTVEQLRYYMFALFTALNHMHRHAVIHRDVKVRTTVGLPWNIQSACFLSRCAAQPSNFLYSVQRNEFLLVDLGLAELDEFKVVQSEQTDTALQNYSKATHLMLSFPRAGEDADLTLLSKSAAFWASHQTSAQQSLKLFCSPVGKLGGQAGLAPEDFGRQRFSCVPPTKQPPSTSGQLA